MIQTFGLSTLYLLQLDTISLSALNKKIGYISTAKINKKHDEQKLLSEINGRSEIFGTIGKICLLIFDFCVMQNMKNC